MASRIQGITVEIGGDTTKLSKALESVNKSIKGTQSGLKDVNKLLKLDPSNTDGSMRSLNDILAGWGYRAPGRSCLCWLLLHQRQLRHRSGHRGCRLQSHPDPLRGVQRCIWPRQHQLLRVQLQRQQRYRLWSEQSAEDPGWRAPRR